MLSVKQSLFRFLAHSVATLGRSAAASGGDHSYKSSRKPSDQGRRERGGRAAAVYSIGSAP